MSDSEHTLTTAQMQSMITPAMQAMMTPTQQKQMQSMMDTYVGKLQNTGARLPTDAGGRAFTLNTPCVVQQDKNSAGRAFPSTLAGASVSVVGTSGERVRVRLADGREQEFNKADLEIK